MKVGTAVALVALASFLAGIAGLWAGRRAGRRNLEHLLDDDRRAIRVLEGRADVAAQARQVRDRILASMQDGVLLLDGEHRTVFANDALDRLLGSRPEALSQLLPAILRQVVRRVVETSGAEVTETEVGSPVRWLRVTATPAGEDGAVLVVVADVTEARRLDAVRRDFVANASHELEDPCRVDPGGGQDPLGCLGRGPRGGATLRRTARTGSGAPVQDRRRPSRPFPAGIGEQVRGRVRLDALVREESSRFKKLAGNKQVCASRSTPQPCRWSTRHGRDLSLLVRNLFLDNAIRYTTRRRNESSPPSRPTTDRSSCG